MAPACFLGMGLLFRETTEGVAWGEIARALLLLACKGKICWW